MIRSLCGARIQPSGSLSDDKTADEYFDAQFGHLTGDVLVHTNEQLKEQCVESLCTAVFKLS